MRFHDILDFAFHIEIDYPFRVKRARIIFCREIKSDLAEGSVGTNFNWVKVE